MTGPGTKTPRLTHGGTRLQASLAVPSFHQWDLPDGSPWIEAFRLEGTYLLRFPDLADFEVSDDGMNTKAWAVPGIEAATVDHLFLSQVVPLALSRQGHLVLHGSAVEVDGGCVAFIGQSGRGKSTLAASFATSGSRFLTDDGLQLRWMGEVLHALPSNASIRLWDDSRAHVAPPGMKLAPPVHYTRKARILAGEGLPHCDSPRPARCVYLLGDVSAASIAITPVRAGAATLELVRHSFLLDVDERQMLALHFDEVSRIANAGLLYHLDYPRDFDQLDAVRHAILRHTNLR